LATEGFPTEAQDLGNEFAPCAGTCFADESNHPDLRTLHPCSAHRCVGDYFLASRTMGRDSGVAMRYRLSTLLILAAVLPPLLALLASTSVLTLAVAGWWFLIVFALYISASDARRHSRFRDE
jgi:hypothetical protein